jgi:hypothetical protein
MDSAPIPGHDVVGPDRAADALPQGDAWTTDVMRWPSCAAGEVDGWVDGELSVDR